MGTVRVLMMVLVAAGLHAQSSAAPAPVALNRPANVDGVIERMQIAPLAGMPAMDVVVQGARYTILLCSLRYLMEQDFPLRAGERVKVKGFWIDDTIVAAIIELPGKNRILRLRDENGRPVWRGRGGRGPKHKEQRRGGGAH